MAIKIGITGGIGSGKSVVSRLLGIMGIPVYISDIEAKRITQTDPVIRRGLCDLVGQDVFQGGELNRSLLASYMFGHQDHVRKVNEIIHPQVKEDFRQWAARLKSELLVGMESAILVEAGFKDEVDFLVMVYAPLEVRVERAVKRDCSSRELVMKRIEAQMSDEVKRSYADFVIVNDDETPLIPQVLELISLLSKNNHYLCSKLISQGKNMLIVESVNAEKKRFPAYGNEKIISLADIAMYTDDAEVPLYDVLESIKEKEKSAQASIDPKKATPEQLREYLAEVLPNFDRERVYVADIKKLVAWYNILISNGITEFKPEGEIKEEEVAE